MPNYFNAKQELVALILRHRVAITNINKIIQPRSIPVPPAQVRQ